MMQTTRGGVRSADKRSAWMGLVILLSLAEAGCGSARWAGPQDTLQRYLAAIDKNNPVEAYALMDESLRRQMTQTEFVTKWNAHQQELKEQAVAIRAAWSKPLKARAQITYASGTRAHLSLEDRRWQIDEGIAVTLQAATPIDALRAFIRAVEQRSYEGVMKLLAKPVRENIERDINDRLSKLKQALNQEIEVTGSRARIQYDPRFKIELTNEDGQWKVQDFD
jgi:hypothetical protein